MSEPAAPPSGWGIGGVPPGPGPAGWAPPDVKPGIVALRPLGVGDILDGAIAAIRTNPRTFLGLSAVVVAVTTLLQLAAALLLHRDAVSVATAAAVYGQSSLSELVAGLGDAGVVYVGSAVLSWAATLVLGGVLAVAVGRAVLGQRPPPVQAWRAVRPWVWARLVGALAVSVLVAAAPPVIAAAVAVAAGLAGAPTALVAALVLLAVVAVGPLCLWLSVRLALAGPALVLESVDGSRPIGVIDALRRSSRLVSGAWWRTCGLLLLVAVIAGAVSGVVAAPLAAAASFLPAGGPGALALQSLGSFVAGLLTTPFGAAAVTLVYIDRRIRTEGLAAKLARAAGVALPG